MLCNMTALIIVWLYRSPPLQLNAPTLQIALHFHPWARAQSHQVAIQHCCSPLPPRSQDKNEPEEDE